MNLQLLQICLYCILYHESWTNGKLKLAMDAAVIRRSLEAAQT